MDSLLSFVKEGGGAHWFYPPLNHRKFLKHTFSAHNCPYNSGLWKKIISLMQKH